MRLSVLLAFLLALSAPATADVIEVPGDFPTIQLAVDNALPGDEIRIAAGTYIENVQLTSRRDLVIHSVSGPDVTIVDGNLLGAAFSLYLCQRITIADLGIRRGDTGLRVHDSTSIEITGCTIEDNVSTGDGGGIWAIGSNIAIENNRILDNSANVGASLDGGGIYCFVTSGVIADNLFRGNRAQEGGGIIINSSTVPFLDVVRNLFVDNEATWYGGAVYVNRGTRPEITRNTLAGNRAGVSGAGIWYTEMSEAAISNNIVAGNTAPLGGGIMAFLPSAAALFTCNDVWGNAGGDYAGYVVDPTGSAGNISADPLFCGASLGDYRLDENSPCAPDNSPGECGLIGALDVGCGVTAVEPATWGGIKGRYSTAKRSGGESENQ